MTRYLRTHENTMEPEYGEDRFKRPIVRKKGKTVQDQEQSREWGAWEEEKKVSRQ